MKMPRCFFAVALLFAWSPLFSATMHSRVRQVPKATQEQVFITPKETLPELVRFLIAGAGDTGGKVKILHDWICDNIAYDTDVFTDKGAGPQDYESVLKKKKGVCSGYSNLMSAMCYYAKIDVDIIPGWSKGFNYPGYLRTKSDHAWNAVKIGNRWQLIDVTWDAGFVEYGTFIKHYSTEWLSRTPAQFIYSHLPEEEKWQLLGEKSIRTPEQFVKEPYIAGIFFDYGLSFGKNAPDYKNSIAGVTPFDFVISQSNVAILADIYGDGSLDTDHCIWLENAGKNKRFFVDVPNRKKYTVRLGARTNGVTSNPTYFSQAEYEQSILPGARALLEKKKITQNELDFFEKSYFLVDENHRYYYSEDLFATQRNAANTKILKLLSRNTSRYENVLRFEVVAADGYEGRGTAELFPQMYQAYNTAQNIRLVTPLEAILKAGSEQHFEIATTAFTSLAIVLGDNDFVFFKKNQKTGVFEADFTIPDSIQELNIFASKNGKEYATLISYQVN